MAEVLVYTLSSVIVVSLISFVGVLTLGIKDEILKKILIYMVSFSAGALFGDAFIHLLPGIAEKGFSLNASAYILTGISSFFVLEKAVQWHHYHLPHTKEQAHPFAVMNLFGDTVHNFTDGLIIGATYLLSIPAGMATTLAVILHEIPQEISDFGVLLHGGFSKGKALFFNFLSAISAVFGAVLALLISSYAENITQILVPFAVGGFIYIAGVDLIPELHKEFEIRKSLYQFAMFILGILVMASLLILE